MTVERAALVSDAHARCLFERKELREALESHPPSGVSTNVLLPAGLALFFGLTVGLVVGARVLR